MRRLSPKEWDACLIMARGRLSDGEPEDGIEDHLVVYLFARGWDNRSADRAATEVVQHVLAERDGIAGAAAVYE